MIVKILLFFVCTNFVFSYGLDVSDPKYETVEMEIPKLGLIRGRVGKSFFTKRPLYYFMGINYAKPPSGERRFKAPEKFGKWDGVYSAVKMRQHCPQVSSPYYPPLSPDQLDVKKDVEDCLVVNVFTPKKAFDTKKKFPVMFYIHGGSFYAGSAYEFFPDFLLEDDIVLVVVQYRLGILGFLSLDTEEIPGNLGMLDIMLGLEWVQENIHAFGGNQSEVTVVGQSAGAAAASSLLISPMVRPGLFHKMIIQSGSALSTWAVDDDPVKSALAMANLLNCSSTDISNVTACFKKASVDDLIKAHYSYESEEVVRCATSLVVQKNVKNKFLPEHPRESYIAGNFKKIPLMGGATREEGISFVTGFFFGLQLAHMNNSKYYERNVTRDVLKFCGNYPKNLDVMADYLHNFHFEGKKTASFEDVAPGLTDICSVALLKGSTYENLRYVSSKAPAFLYSFNFNGNISKFKLLQPEWNSSIPIPKALLLGVAHSDDLGYLFPNFKLKYTQRELQMVKVMTSLWSNFVKFGKPAKSGDWPQMSTAYGPYLRLSDKNQIRKNIFDEYMVTSREGFLTGLAGTNKISYLLVTITFFAILFVNIS